MPHTQNSPPPLEIPLNVRQGRLSRNEFLWVSLRVSLDPLAFSICTGLYCILASIVFLYGPHELAYITYREYALLFAFVCIFYFLILFISIAYPVYKIGPQGISVTHGFTQEYIYGANAFYQAVDRWEYYSRWKETKKHMLLKRGRWYVMPKSMWAEEELAELRALMRQKVGKRLEKHSPES